LSEKNYLNPLWVYYTLKWKYPRQTQLVLFYLLIWIVVFILSGLVGDVLGYVALIALSLAYMRYNHIRIPRGRMVIGALGGILSISLLFAALLLSGVISIVSVSPDYLSIIAFGALFQVLVAAGEELSFRNCLFQQLDGMVGRLRAAIISSAAFAVMHVPILLLLGMGLDVIVVTVLAIFAGGLVLASLYVHGGLPNAFAFHFFWNTLEYYVFGLGPIGSALVLKVSAGTLISGAGYGPESSVPGLIVLAATFVALGYVYKKQYGERTAAVQNS
jgi:membrane protease YdiL (CAAX protease family)